jgi:hypothetical protein
MQPGRRFHSRKENTLMKNELNLMNPIQIDGKSVKTLTYDTDEVTCELFAQADAQKLRVTGGAAKGSISGAAELDYSFHLYLGFAAIIAINPSIDYSDLNRIKGPDVMEVMKIGRNFIRPRSEELSEGDDFDGQSETTPELSTPQPAISKKDA